jgi:hypothetical protein
LKLSTLLKPSPAQMQRFALRETDPDHAARFEPIARGPMVALLLLAWVGVAAIVAVPVDLLARVLRGDR